MKTIREAISAVNRVFNKNYGRENVIALWTEAQLRGFKTEELAELKRLAELELGLRLNDNTFRRLLRRVTNVAKEKEESIRENNRDSDTNLS
jgi:hypothetical protein